MKEAIAPHDLIITYIGAGLLCFGWFGFNAGFNLEANGLTAVALLNTIIAPAAAALAWAIGEKVTRGHSSALGVVSGAVAGLVCLLAVVTLKPMLKYDDSLNVFGIHGIGGIVGALGTTIVANRSFGGYPLDGYDMGGQFVIQATAVGVAVVWSGVVVFIALQIVKAIFGGLRVPKSAESGGKRWPGYLQAWRARLQQLVIWSRRYAAGTVSCRLIVAFGSCLPLARHKGFPLAKCTGYTPRSIRLKYEKAHGFRGPFSLPGGRQLRLRFSDG